MRVQFCGAAGTVTGSATLLEAGGTRVLVDCGQFQGPHDLEARNRDRFPFDPKDLDALVLTHGHIDHCGRAPRLVKAGFRGRVLCTRATAEIATLMLLDSAKIAREEEEHGGPPAPFDDGDVEALYLRMRPCRYGETVEAGAGVRVRLTDAGHILGSAHALVTMSEGNRSFAFGVSGDVGVRGRPLVADPTPLEAADAVQVEATYGDRDHRTGEDSVKELEGILRRAEEDHGVVLVPAFALGRTQDLLWHLNAMKEAGRLKGLEVFVDSPLATRLTAVFRKNEAFYDDDAKGHLRRGDDPFDFPGLRVVRDAKESQRVTHEAAGAVIIAASGMCQSGRIVHHLQALLPRPSTRIVVVGYQAPGTLGRRLVDGAKEVRVRGREVAVRATVHTLGGFSAHAGRSDLLAWLRGMKRPPATVFVCHGEPPSLASFAQAVRDEFGCQVHVPRHLESFAL